MKKITIALLSLIAVPSFAQVTSYSDAETFEMTYDGTLTVEDFSGAPDEPSICGTVVSSTVNDCFAEGELVSGFALSTLDETEVVLLPAGFLPSDNQTPRLGANSGADTTVLTFTEPVFAVGLSLHVDNNGDFNCKAYNSDNEIIYDEDHDHSPFFGITSQEGISRIEIGSLAGNGELIGDLQFGTQGTMATPQNRSITATCYPNPAGDVLNIQSDSTINNISVLNLLGQTVLTQKADGTAVSLDLSAIAGGSYFVKVTAENGSTGTFKILRK